MKSLHWLAAGIGLAVWAAGCGESRVHVLPDVQQIHRVAVVNLTDRSGKPTPESEFFTNEFVSVGFSVVERGHLQDIIKEAFTETGYLDERSVAQWGRGLGIDGVVLHQLLSNTPANSDGDVHDVAGWVRLVDVETGQILLTYNFETQASSRGNPTRAAKQYAERIVDDLRRAMQKMKIQPTPANRAEMRQVDVREETSSQP